MAERRPLPFEVGQLAEAKSFQTGFRGAWFRCKIHKITKSRGHSVYYLEYYDYPDEEIKRTKLYQKPPIRTSSNQKEVKSVLMLRPCFPRVCLENELPDVDTNSEVTVVVDGVWQVGDLVDWLSDGCFWSGTVIERINDDEVKIKLLDPPLGEGETYKVKCKDLRPSLDWSPEIGWTVPELRAGQKGHLHVRLIQPFNQEDDKQNIKSTRRSSLEFDESSSSHTSDSITLLKQSMQSKDLMSQGEDDFRKGVHKTHEDILDFSKESAVIGKTSRPDSVSSPFVRDVADLVPGAASDQEQYQNHESAKKLRADETISLNSTTCDSLESSIVDLEELVNRVKWLRQILKLGTPSSSIGPTWKLEQTSAAVPK